MIVRTCLLISDDPDDHIEFSEALHEISSDTVLMTVSDVKKAAHMLVLKKCLPECIFLNLAMADVAVDDFFSVLSSDPSLADITIIGFGEKIDGNNIDTSRVTTFLDDESSFSELKSQLKKIIGNLKPPRVS